MPKAPAKKNKKGSPAPSKKGKPAPAQKAAKVGKPVESNAKKAATSKLAPSAKPASKVVSKSTPKPSPKSLAPKPASKAPPAKVVAPKAQAKAVASKPVPAKPAAKPVAGKPVAAKSVTAKPGHTAPPKPTTGMMRSGPNKLAAKSSKASAKNSIPVDRPIFIPLPGPRPGSGPSKVAIGARSKAEYTPPPLPPAPITTSGATLAKNQAGLTKSDLEFYRDLLLAKRREILGDMSHLQNEALRAGGEGSLSNLPIHMAEVGTDNYEQEFTLGLVEKDRTLLREINAALAKISAGTFGLCEATLQPISKPRLEAQPWARYSIEHARSLEKSRFRR